MLGYEINKSILDGKSAEAVVGLRMAFAKIETINAWLDNNPSDNENDPLVTDFQYTADEAYALRLYFQTFDQIRVSNQNIFDVGRKISGLA